MSISFQPIAVETDSQDCDGLLVFAEGRLVGLLVRLVDEVHHPSIHGAWFLEAAFGRAERHQGSLFASLGEAEGAIAGWLSRQAVRR